MEAIEYRDFLIATWSDETPGFFKARAVEEFGRATSPVRLRFPFDDRWFIQYVDRLDELNFRELHYVGARLFDSLFQGDILRLYVHLLEQIRPTGTKLRIRLQLEPPIVARLPWECLYDTRSGTFLSASDDVILVRYLQPADGEPRPVPARPPLRVLLVADAPEDAETARVATEGEVVRRALKELEGEGRLNVEEVGAGFGERSLTASGLQKLLWQNFDVFHLVCDASWDGDRGGFHLGGETIDSSALARIVGSNTPCLVVWSGGKDAGKIAPTFAEELLQTTPALLSQSYGLSLEFIERYVQSFYQALAGLKPLDVALAVARSEVLSHFPVESEWLSPALFLSRRDGTVLENKARVVNDVYQLSEGRYRRSLRETLNRIWPKPERYTRQLLRFIPRKEPLATYMHAADLLSQPQDAAELSRRFQRLLVLGEHGAGKSMSLYRLFYEAAQPVLSYEAKSPLPVYVPLPDVPAGVELSDFLVKGFDRDLFLSDLEEGRFLFLLDSLDALSTGATARRVDTLNEFMHRFPMNRFVVAARDPVPKALDIANWAEMVPFAEWEAIDFLIGDESVRAEAARDLYRQLASGMGKRAGNPQVLAMARRLWREGARVPPQLTALFQAFFQVAGRELAAETRDGLLPQLAFFMTKADRLSLRREHLEEEARPRELPAIALEVAFRRVVAQGLDELLAEVEKTRLLKGPRAFTFPNLAFQEFLTAVAMRMTDHRTVLQLVPPADWRVIDEVPHNISRGSFHGVLPFLCGLLEDGPRLVETLVERDLVLAARCYPECRVSTSLDLVLRAAVERELSSADELRAKVACMALEARGDDWSVEWLEQMASAAESPARAVALAALGNLRSARSLEVLESAAREDDPRIARAALDAMARIKVS